LAEVLRAGPLAVLSAREEQACTWKPGGDERYEIPDAVVLGG